MTQSEIRRALNECISEVRSLCSEVSAAIGALSRNDLDELQARLNAQDSICKRLSLMKQSPADLMASTDFIPERAESTVIAQLKAELHQSFTELQHLNRVFAALLQRSAQTVGMFAAVYQNCPEGYFYGGDRQNSKKLSCEA